MVIYIEKKQVLLMIWKLAWFMICTPQSFQLLEMLQKHYLNMKLLTRQKEHSCHERTWIINSLVFLYQAECASTT